ncbi:MAG TPA: MraY family glycosyltransferase, partial [Arenimonas sp.]|nr:MraY family glycosyltransferase [Arenimonas sp.]
GDAGSMLIGFAIAWYAVRLSQNPSHPVSPVLGPWTLAIPLIDCTVLMVRRWRQGRSPFSADRNHLHHMLLDAGYSAAAIAFGLAVLSLLLGLGAAVAIKLGIYRPLLVLLFIALWFAYYALTVDRDRAVRVFRAIHPGRRRLSQPLPAPYP